MEHDDPLLIGENLLNGAYAARRSSISAEVDYIAGLEGNLGFVRGYLASTGAQNGYSKKASLSDIKHVLANPSLVRLFSTESPKKKSYENDYSKDKKEIPKAGDEKSESKDFLWCARNHARVFTFIAIAGFVFASLFLFGNGEQKQIRIV